MAASNAAFQIGGYECVSPDAFLGRFNAAYWPQNFWGKVPSVRIGRGREPGEANLIITQATLSALTLSNAQTITVVHDAGTLTLQGWFATEVESVTGINGTNSFYFIRLRDRRQIGEVVSYSPTSIVKDTWEAYPKKSPDSTNRTWAALIDSLWTALPTEFKGASSTTPSLAVTPSSYPQNIMLEGSTHWQAICKLLNACGHVPIYDPTTNGYRFANPDGTQSGLSSFYTDNASKLIWDGFIPGIEKATCPANVGILFPSDGCYNTSQHAYETPYSTTVSTGLSGASGSVAYYVTDSTYALFNPASPGTTGSIQNTTQLNNRITDIKRTINGIAKSIGNRVNRVYQGILSILPGEEVSEVTWKIDNQGKPVTIVRRDGKFDIEMPNSFNVIPPTQQRIYKYTLTSRWTSGSASANITGVDSYMSGGGNWQTGGTVYDPNGIATSQVSGNSGQCVLVNGRFYVVGGGGGSSTPAGRIAYTTSEITGRASSTPPTITLGKGTANLFTTSLVSTDYLATRDSPQTNVTVLNLESVAIPSGRWIQVKQVAGGHWIVDWEAC